MEAEVTLHQEYERELPPADQPRLHLRGRVNVFAKCSVCQQIFQKSWASVHLLPSRAPGVRNTRARGETATRGPGGSWGSGGGTSSDERSVMVTVCPSRVNISFPQGVAVKKQQSFESYLDSDGNKKQQPDSIAGCSDSYPGWNWGLEALFRASSRVTFPVTHFPHFVCVYK